jgi:aerobic-type carbon monoxide dehydrogenase small subunit (CoxS/CutS family)
MVALTVNGTTHEVERPARSFLSWLRFDLGLTGTKYGCGGEVLYGACTVLLDGQPLRACLSTVGAVAGGEITTIEELADGETLHPVQEAFVAEQAMHSMGTASQTSS